MITKKITAIISFCFATILAFLPFNYIIGSKFAWFSCVTFVAPALGYQYSLVYVILLIFTKYLCSKTILLFFVLHKLPLMFATLSLQKRHFLTSIALPIFAMLLFCLHPVGSQAFAYSWYWFIPMLLYRYTQDSLYSRALSASFIAHAVGSVIWLYKGNIAAPVWVALIPIVAIERLLIAAAMIACVHIFKAIASSCNAQQVVL